MPCAGKNGNGCSCQGFQAIDNGNDPSSKCNACRHRKKYHTSPISDVLATFDLARLRTKATDSEARRETNAGFRGASESKVKGKGKASNSKAPTKPSVNEMVKVGSVQVIGSGVDADGKPRNTKCPSPKDVEEMVEVNLAVYKDPKGHELEFETSWDWERIDTWLREMVKPKKGPGVFDYLDARYGVPDGESDSHWVLVAKTNRSIFVKRGPINGELLDTAKGSSGHRKSREHAVRIVTAHRIPSSVSKDWSAALARVAANETILSESEVEEKPKVRATKGKGRARADVSSPEAVESEDSDSDDVPTRVTAPTRRSSRVRAQPATVKSEMMEVELNDDAAREKNGSLFADADSDIEEIPRPEADAATGTFQSLKRSASPSFDFLDSQGGNKRARSASYGSVYSWYPEDFDNDDDGGASPFLQPVTSSFSAPPILSASDSSSTSGPSSSASAISMPSFSSTSVVSSSSSALAGPSFTPTSAGPSSSSGTVGPSSTSASVGPSSNRVPVASIKHTTARRGLQIPSAASNIWRR
ncbi:hypothetical protein B0H11DRAFT_2079131 [Mycena galericulata]|nr:hypothetical protein B0H11DRAFT_2079131 [Mycena galericulata]